MMAGTGQAGVAGSRGRHRGVCRVGGLAGLLGGFAQAWRSPGLAFQGRKHSRSGPDSGFPPLRPQASRYAVR